MENYYDILKVKSDATAEQIKRSYITLVTKFHPDVYSGDKVYAEQVTSSLTEAYSILKDEERRKEYDNAHRVNTIDTIYQNYYSEKQSDTENDKPYYGKNYDQESSRKYFKNAKRKSRGINFFQKLFTSKLFYCLLFVFAIEALIIYFVYIKSL